ncbi:hypothetical protein IKN40_07600 [bacterium]|nr:hypothetical protein [bacterium]
MKFTDSPFAIVADKSIDCFSAVLYFQFNPLRAEKDTLLEVLSHNLTYTSANLALPPDNVAPVKLTQVIVNELIESSLSVVFEIVPSRRTLSSVFQATTLTSSDGPFFLRPIF